MIKVIQTTPEHLDSLDPKEIFEHKDAILYTKAAIGSNCPAYSLVNGNGEIIGIVGGWFIYPGVMEAFGLFSKQVELEKFSFHRAVKEIADKAFDLFSLHRLQCVVRDDYPSGQRWAALLGFEPEGVLRQYGPQKHDYLIYGRIR